MLNPKRYVRIRYTNGDQPGTLYLLAPSPEHDQERLVMARERVEELFPGAWLRESAVVLLRGGQPIEDEVVATL